MLRRAALYGAPTFGAGWQKCYSALFFVLEQRFGGKNRIWRRSTHLFDPLDVADDVAIAVVVGLTGRAPSYVKRSLELGVPTLIVDEGWLRPERGYWQVSPGWIDVPPPIAPSSKRFEDLQLRCHPVVKRDRDTVLVGERADDPRHDLTSDAAVLSWAKKAALDVKALDRRRQVFWRPHKELICTLGPPTILTQHNRLMQDLVELDLVGSAVVYNSPLGLDLLRNGVRVVAQGPRTVYTDLVPSDIGSLATAHPGPDKVQRLLERLAYGQYKISELANWSTLEQLLELHGITGDW